MKSYCVQRCVKSFPQGLVKYQNNSPRRNKYYLLWIISFIWLLNEWIFLFSEIKYSWVFNGWRGFLQQDARRFISQRTGNLYIAKVEASDAGNYTCAVRNMMTNATVFSSPTPVVVRRDGKPASSVHLRCSWLCHTLNWHTLLGAWHAWQMNYPSWAWRGACSGRGGEVLRRPNASPTRRVVYMRNHLRLHEGTYSHEHKCRLWWQKRMQAPAQQGPCHTQ